MNFYNIHEAKSQLSKLVEAVERGETVTIARAGSPVALLVPLRAVPPPRVRGLLRQQINLGAEFDAPLTTDELGMLEDVE